MGRRLPPETAPTLAGYELKKQVERYGLAHVACMIDVAEFTLSRYAGTSRTPTKEIRDRIWRTLGIPRNFWEILLVRGSEPARGRGCSDNAPAVGIAPERSGENGP